LRQDHCDSTHDPPPASLDGQEQARAPTRTAAVSQVAPMAALTDSFLMVTSTQQSHFAAPSSEEVMQHHGGDHRPGATVFMRSSPWSAWLAWRIRLAHRAQPDDLAPLLRALSRGGRLPLRASSAAWGGWLVGLGS
jgi:hypothetical protein